MKSAIGIWILFNFCGKFTVLDAGALLRKGDCKFMTREDQVTMLFLPEIPLQKLGVAKA